MKSLTTYKKELLPRPVFSENERLVELYYAAFSLAYKNLDYTELLGGREILTCMPGSGKIWQWDSAFMTLMTNYSNGTLSALNNLDRLYALRRKEDGFMAMAYRLDTQKPAYGERINPPIMALMEWEYYLVSGDASRFSSILPALEGIYSFIENNRKRNEIGLYYFEDTGSSGMDNSPVSGYFARHLDGSDTCFLDLACQQAISADALSKITERLGENEKSAYYKSECERIINLINRHHYSERAGWYLNLFARAEEGKRPKFINSKTAAGFWALLSGAAKGERLQAVVKTLLNPEEFNTKIPFATLSRLDPNYEELGGYWLGGVWAPTNYVAIRALMENGYRKDARKITLKYLNAILSVYENKDYGSIWECYAPDRIRPASTEEKELCRPDFVGWSGIGPVTLFIESLIGLSFKADENAVILHPESEKRAGLENMLFNGAKISVVYEKQSDGRLKISTNAEKPTTLLVYKNETESPVCLEIPRGEQIYTV